MTRSPDGPMTQLKKFWAMPVIFLLTMTRHCDSLLSWKTQAAGKFFPRQPIAPYMEELCLYENHPSLRPLCSPPRAPMPNIPPDRAAPPPIPHSRDQCLEARRIRQGREPPQDHSRAR